MKVTITYEFFKIPEAELARLRKVTGFDASTGVFSETYCDALDEGNVQLCCARPPGHKGKHVFVTREEFDELKEDR